MAGHDNSNNTAAYLSWSRLRVPEFWQQPRHFCVCSRSWDKANARSRHTLPRL